MANERQVGGDHYRTNGVQHWDLFGPDYLIGYATKYMRWRKKGGVQDLEKAIHVIEKLKELTNARPFYDKMVVTKWCSDAGLDWTERRIVNLIMFSKGDEDLDEAISGIRHLIKIHELQPPDFTAVNHKLKIEPKFKPYSEMTDDELRAESACLQEANDRAPGWGAAFCARWEDICTIKNMLAARAFERQRTPEDGGQHAAVAPWLVNSQWFLLDANKNITDELRDRFFRERTRTTFTMEPHVASSKLPRQLAVVYRMVNDDWHLRIENCPADVREYYPSLPRECNLVELGELPEWQRRMYVPDDSMTKNVLLPEFAAWHAETE